MTRECDANPNEFKCVCHCQNITAFDLKTALFRSLIRGGGIEGSLYFLHDYKPVRSNNVGEY